MLGVVSIFLVLWDSTDKEEKETKNWVLFFFFFFFLWGVEARVSLCISGYPGTHSLDQDQLSVEGTGQIEDSPQSRQWWLARDAFHYPVKRILPDLIPRRKNIYHSKNKMQISVQLATWKDCAACHIQDNTTGDIWGWRSDDD